MMRTMKSLRGHRLLATDGELGKAREFYFDDEGWIVRYLVADTGNWLPGRLVLISPQSLGHPVGGEDALAVSLTKKQIEESPSINADKPVSRQFEREFYGFYGLAPYWAVPPIDLSTGRRPGSGSSAATATEKDTHLRSSREVIGYHIEASDGDIGHVEDFVVETDDWTIRYMVVDTRNWLPGRKVLVAPSWIISVHWSQRVVRVDMTRDRVEGSPEFDPEIPINREYETRLYDYYGRPRYW